MPGRTIWQGRSARLRDGRRLNIQEPADQERDAAKARAAQVARASYGKLLAILSARSGDIMAAEDALADAFRLALEHWPIHGVPNNPEGWLITTAKNRRIDAQRRAMRAPMVPIDDHFDLAEPRKEEDEMPDRRLALLFVCTHPAIDRGIHTPLMLQTVLGFEAVDIARSFLISPTAIAQRLVRAKQKIKDARIPFQIPDLADMPSRISAVLEAIYGAYAMAWLSDPNARDMTGEALYLASLLVTLAPNEAEVRGLAALIGFAHARRHARIQDGAFVPLHEQDQDLWDAPMIAQAEMQLTEAAKLKKIGRFQLEAAIQAIHAKRAEEGATNWMAVLHLTEGLCKFWPTLGARTSRAAVIGEVFGVEAGLSELAIIMRSEGAAFQPAHATKAHLLARKGDIENAAFAYEKAISLTTEPTVRRWLERQRTQLN